MLRDAEMQIVRNLIDLQKYNVFHKRAIAIEDGTHNLIFTHCDSIGNQTQHNPADAPYPPEPGLGG